MGFFQKILDKWSCLHSYEEIYQSKTFSDYCDKRPVKITKTFLCKKCGKFKKVNV